MKLGRHCRRCAPPWPRRGCSTRAVYVERGTMAGERVVMLADKPDDEAPYFSMVLVPGEGRRGGPRERQPRRRRPRTGRRRAADRIRPPGAGCGGGSRRLLPLRGPRARASGPDPACQRQPGGGRPRPPRPAARRLRAAGRGGLRRRSRRLRHGGGGVRGGGARRAGLARPRHHGGAGHHRHAGGRRPARSAARRRLLRPVALGQPEALAGGDRAGWRPCCGPIW